MNKVAAGWWLGVALGLTLLSLTITTRQAQFCARNVSCSKQDTTITDRGFPTRLTESCTSIVDAQAVATGGSVACLHNRIIFWADAAVDFLAYGIVAGAGIFAITKWAKKTEAEAQPPGVEP